MSGDLDNITCHYIFAAIIFNDIYLQSITEHNAEFGKWSLTNRSQIEAEYLADGEGVISIPIEGTVNDIICKPLLLDNVSSYNTVAIYHQFADSGVVYEWFMDVSNQPDGVYINFYTMFNAL